MVSEPSEKSQPLVSVVTVNFNMRNDLQTTIESVSSQVFSGFEFVVVDGASADGSVELLQANAAKIDKWISEPDRNLYDGMNKGVRLASGRWVIFMNSGDGFADTRVLADIFGAAHDDADILYGDALRIYSADISKPLRARPLHTLKSELHCSHQAIFVRREILLARPFSLDLLIADYQQILQCWLAGFRFKQVDRVIAVVSAGGRSDEQRWLTLSQRREVLRQNGLYCLSERLKHPVRTGYAVLSLALRKRMPRIAVKLALNIKSRLC